MNNKKIILEIGCGQGFSTFIRSKKKNTKIIGTDLSKTEIKIAKERYPNVDFRVMNAEKLEFKNDSFDEVYAIEVLEHVNNIKKVLREISRVLKSGGKLIVSIPYHKSEKWLIKIRPTYFKEIHHVRIFKENDLENFCKKEDLFVIRKKRTGFLQHIELYFLFKRNIKSNTQVSIGSWRDNIWTKTLHAGLLYFDPLVMDTPLKFFPIWIVLIPLGWFLNNLGSIYFPKSLYYEFIKK